jgi:uncharacterized protein (DUF1778 family)
MNDHRQDFGCHGEVGAHDLRTTPVVKALLPRAAASSHKKVTEFLLEAGINAAEETLADRRLFRPDDRQWQASVEALDRPVGAKPCLARLLSDKGVLERRRMIRRFPMSRS